LARQAFILGGTGQIGRAVARNLLDQGWKVVVAHRGQRSLPPEPVERGARISILDREQPGALARALADGTDALIDTIAFTQLHADQLLDVQGCVGAFVIISSAAVYGEGREMPMTEDHPLEPVSPYGISKLAAETYVRLYAQLYGLNTFSVRPFSLYGPRQRKLVVYDLLCRAVDGEDPVVVLGSPEVSRDFVFVADCARALVILARRAPARGEAYNVATGVGTHLGRLVPALLESAGVEATIQFTGDIRPGDPLRWEGDPTRALALGAAFDTPLAEGLRQTAEWLLANPRDGTEATPRDSRRRTPVQT